MAAAAELPVHAGPAALASQHADPGGRGADRAGRRAGRLHHGQVLRRHLPRPAARGEARAGARRRASGNASACSGWSPAASLLGLLPSQFIAGASIRSPSSWSAPGCAETVAASGWLLAPISVERASYGPAIFLLGIAASCALAFLLVRRLYHGRLRRAPPWDCGFPWQNAAHAGHGRGLRPADPADLRALLSHASGELPRRPSTRPSRATASASRTTSGTGSICRSPHRSWSAWRGRSACCSRRRIASTCSTASRR